MKKILGIFRGFPGLGRVVAGVSLLETLRDNYLCDIKIISYLQGKKYLESLGYTDLLAVSSMDYCSIGLLPTYKMGVYIHNTISEFMPDIIIIDGEPLILQSIKISHPNIKVVALLNPSDVYNPSNDKEAMDYFNALYSLSDLAIVHGLRHINSDRRYKNLISINTIIRRDIMGVKNVPTNNIYCILGGGTVNVGQQFEFSTLKIGELCQKAATQLPQYTMHIICSCQNIYRALSEKQYSDNVKLYKDIIPAHRYYSEASLIITRSGRNTLSELSFLGIPAISFVSGCSYREVEQANNINDLNIPTIVPASLEITADELSELCLTMIHNKADCCLQSGNEIAIENILQI